MSALTNELIGTYEEKRALAKSPHASKHELSVLMWSFPDEVEENTLFKLLCLEEPEFAERLKMIRLCNQLADLSNKIHQKTISQPAYWLPFAKAALEGKPLTHRQSTPDP